MTDKGQNNDPPPKETSKKEVWIYFLLYFSLGSFFFESSTKKKQAIDSFRHFRGLSCKLQNNLISEAWKKRHFLNELNK